jgi:hypothetical protein
MSREDPPATTSWSRSPPGLQVTETIRFLTDVLLTPTYDTAPLAKLTASVDAISNGRLVLGLGVGAREDDFAAGQDFGNARKAVRSATGRAARVGGGSARRWRVPVPPMKSVDETCSTVSSTSTVWWQHDGSEFSCPTGFPERAIDTFAAGELCNGGPRERHPIRDQRRSRHEAP